MDRKKCVVIFTSWWRHDNANSMDVANKTADEVGNVLCNAGSFAGVSLYLI